MTKEEAKSPQTSAWTAQLAAAQSAYYITTGVFPFISMRAFEKVTGPKFDRWLVKTVGALITVIGATIGAAAARGRITDEIALLAKGSAGALGAVGIVYALKGRISKVYLLDAVLEMGFVLAWARARSRAEADAQAGLGEEAGVRHGARVGSLPSA